MSNVWVAKKQNGITVLLFFQPYAVQELKAVAGVMITASHNRKEDNGYKVNLGLQLSAYFHSYYFISIICTEYIFYIGKQG